MREVHPSWNGYFFLLYFIELPVHCDNKRQTFRQFTTVFKFSVHNAPSYCLHLGQTTPNTAALVCHCSIVFKKAMKGFSILERFPSLMVQELVCLKGQIFTDLENVFHVEMHGKLLCV